MTSLLLLDKARPFTTPVLTGNTMPVAVTICFIGYR